MAKKTNRLARSLWKWPVRLTAVVLAAVLLYVFVIYESFPVTISPGAYEGNATSIVQDNTLDFKNSNIALNTLIGNTEFMHKSAFGRAMDILSMRLGSSESFDVLYKSAAVKIAKGEYGEALPFIDACINSGGATDDETRAALWLKKGCLLSLMNAGDAALTALKKALDFSPKAVDAYYVMMQIYVGRNNLARAIDCMRIYRRTVDNDETRAVMGDLLTADGKYQEADGLYTLLVGSGQAGGHAQFMRGICKLQTGGYVTAEEDFTTCFEAGTEKAMSLYYRGVIRLKLERYQEAESDFTDAINEKREDASFMELLYNRGVSRMAQGRYADAAGDFQASYEAGEAVKDSLFYCGMCKLKTGENERAVALFNTCLENGWTLGEVAYYRGMAYLNLGYSQEAAADFEASEKAGLLPGESAYYAGLSRMALKEYGKAAENFTKACARAALETAIPLAECQYNRGLCLLETGEYALAEDALKDAVAAGKPGEEAAFSIGVARYHRGAYPEAIESFGESIAAGRNVMDSRINRGLCLMALKRYNEAVGDFTACLELDPKAKTARYYRGLSYQALGEAMLAEADLKDAVDE